MHTAFLRPLRHVALVAMASILTMSMAAPAAPSAAEQPATPRRLAIAIHGGAGVIARDQLGADGGAAYRQGLEAALDAGYAVLEAGGSSLDAVTTAVRLLEDNPLFNAGRGAVLAHDGRAYSMRRSCPAKISLPARSPASPRCAIPSISRGASCRIHPM